MIQKRISILLFMTLISYQFLPFVNVVNAENTATFIPIASRSVCQASQYNESDLVVMSIEYGIKSYVYITFDLSELPANAIPTSVILKIKNENIAYTCWVSAFCSPNADWVETGMTWDTKPDFGEYVDADYIDTMREWYSWGSSSLLETVLESLKETEKLTITLKTGIGDDSEYGLVIFSQNIILEINYILDITAPTYSNIIVQPSNPTPDDEATVNVTVTDDQSGVKEVFLYYSIDDGVNWIKILMSSVGNSKYEATISQQSKDKTVEYYVETFDNALNTAKSNTLSYTVRLLKTIISCSISDTTITIGNPVIISGLINPAISGKIVTLTYTKPDETTKMTRKVTTNSDGSFSDSYEPNTIGVWSITAQWEGDATHEGASSMSKSFTVNPESSFFETPTGIAVIGGGILVAIIIAIIVFKRRK